MKILLDSCVWGGNLALISARGYDVVWAGNWSEDPGDDEIIATAYNEGRILVTLDKDFGELAIVRGTPHCGIIRLVNVAAQQQAMVCLQVISLYGEELQAGAIVTASPSRLRIRAPESDSIE